MAKSDVFLSAIEQAGLRITEQRRIICDYLAQNRTHPTPSQVYEDVSRERPDISRATVYNTLNVLQEIGAIVGISFGDGHTHYETNTATHVNLVCLGCHKIIDVPASAELSQSSERWSSYGFEPLNVKTDVFGFCLECRERRRLEIVEQARQRLAQAQPEASEEAS